jgi:rhodanese-related sulfurtransferase
MTTLGTKNRRGQPAAWGQHLAGWMGGALLLALAGVASAADVPATLAGVSVVTAEQARKLVDAGTPVIDTRVGNEFADAHIKGARNVPYKEKSAKDAGFNARDDQFDLARLPGDKAAPVIFYCNGPECWKSYKASKVAADAGWRKVQWLRGGFPEWKAKGYAVE